MKQTPIHIGDSGWRAVYADGFTVERLSAIIAALGEIVPHKKALVGFDNRFLSDAFARHAAAGLVLKGWEVDLIADIFPTPGVGKMVRTGGPAGQPYDFGLIITASHNPFYYNGLKILDGSGSLIERSLADRIQKQANLLLESPARDRFLSFDLNRSFDRILEAKTLRESYLDTILSKIDVDAIRAAKLSIAWDSFGGTSTPLFPLLADRLNIRHHQVPMGQGPTFGGRRLEPDAASLTELAEWTTKTQSIIGLATDVDGDRFSVVDETGASIQNNLLGSLLVWYLLEARGERGNVYQTISGSRMTERICQKFGVPLTIEPVGFMKMGRDMIADKQALIGIEETGGLAYAPHLPFKDGLMAHALILEMLAVRQITIPVLIEDLRKTYGFFHYRRIDLKLPSQEEANRWMDTCLWERKTGETALETSTLDGVKWFFPSGWVLIRRSKTEPLLRIYFESEDPSFVERIAKEIR